MRVKYLFYPLLLHMGFLMLPGSNMGQESVDVPQLLQKDVHIFKLSIDSLETLTTDIQAHTKKVMQELKLIQQQMQLMPKDTRKYRVKHKQYEEKLSEYWARKVAMLQAMQDLRLRTLTSLNSVLSQLQLPDRQANTQLLNQIQDEVRKTEDQASQTRLEMLQILEALENENTSFLEKQRLTRKFQDISEEPYLSESRRLLRQIRHNYEKIKAKPAENIQKRNLP